MELEGVNQSREIKADHNYPTTREDIAQMSREMNLAHEQAVIAGWDGAAAAEAVRHDYIAAFRARAEAPERFVEIVQAAQDARADGDTRPFAAIYNDLTDQATGMNETTDAELAQMLHGGYYDNLDTVALRVLRPSISEENAERLLDQLRQGGGKARRAVSEILSAEAADEQEIDYQSAIAQMAEARKGRQIEERKPE